MADTKQNRYAEGKTNDKHTPSGEIVPDEAAVLFELLNFVMLR